MQFLSKVSTSPTEPVSLSDMCDWLKVSPDDDPAVVAGLITAARTWAEGFQRRALISEQYLLKMARFPFAGLNPLSGLYEPGTQWDGFWDLPGGILGAFSRRLAITLPVGPLVSVDALTYLDGSGATQTLAANAYQAVTGDDANALLYPADNTFWPVTAFDPAAVSITFTAGYTASTLPANTLVAIKMLVASWYGDREGQGSIPGKESIPPVVKTLLWMDRVLTF